MKIFSSPRILLGIAILMTAIGAPSTAKAAAITYDITLTATAGDLIGGTGAFTYDGTNFSAFTVTWGTEIFDFTSAANGTPTEQHGCDGNASISFFTYLTNTDCGNGYSGEAWLANSFSSNLSSAAFFFSPSYNGIQTIGATGTLNGLVASSGTFTVTSEVPEPASFFLLSLGLPALAMLARKRKFQAS